MSSTTHEGELAEPAPSSPWGPGGLGATRYGMLATCVVAQGVTVGITWPLWQVRDDPPHLPLFSLPQFPFGVLLLVSLTAVLARPRPGVLLHVGVLLLSFVFDQLRTQPQFIAIAVLMVSAVDPRGTALGRWFLASLWLWAGLHKFLSGDWLGWLSWELLAELGLDPAAYHSTFAITVAASEVALGVIAVFRPRWGAVLCVVLHGGIAIFLLPPFLNWNISVIPWNMCTAMVGCWILWSSDHVLPRTKLEFAGALAFLLLPIGFYTGHVDHGIANVLYSDNIPRGLISHAQGVKEIRGWGKLHVPFPNERRLLRSYFQRAAPPRSKLHIADPRPGLPDQYFLKQSDGSIMPLTADKFFAADVGAAAGVAWDSPRSIFLLAQSGARLLRRTPESMVYAVEIPPEAYSELMIRHLARLPNLEQLQLAGCPVRDEHLRHLTTLRRLEGIGLNDTLVTDAGLKILSTLPNLQYVECRNTPVTEEAKRRFEWR